MDKDTILWLLEQATKPQELQLLWSMWCRICNGNYEFEKHIPKPLLKYWQQFN